MGVLIHLLCVSPLKYKLHRSTNSKGRVHGCVPNTRLGAWHIVGILSGVVDRISDCPKAEGQSQDPTSYPRTNQLSHFYSLALFPPCPHSPFCTQQQQPKDSCENLSQIISPLYSESSRVILPYSMQTQSLIMDYRAVYKLSPSPHSPPSFFLITWPITDLTPTSGPLHFQFLGLEHSPSDVTTLAAFPDHPPKSHGHSILCASLAPNLILYFFIALNPHYTYYIFICLTYCLSPRVECELPKVRVHITGKSPHLEKGLEHSRCSNIC